MIKKESIKRVDTKAFDSDKIKCSKCGRALKSSSSGIGDRQKVLCEICYTEMAFPFLNNRYGEAH